jgi:hypothetical protein
MQPSVPPKVIAVEVVTAQPTEADRALITQLSAETNRALAPVAYVVKLRIKTKPPVMSQGWALYVNDFRIPKYWEYEHGIYFKVFDPQFFADHKGQKLRFSLNGTEYVDTGKRLASPPAVTPRSKGTTFPLQSDVLK